MSILEIIGLVSIVGAGLAWIFCAAGSDREVNRTKKNFPFQELVLFLLISGAAAGQKGTRGWGPKPFGYTIPPSAVQPLYHSSAEPVTITVDTNYWMPKPQKNHDGRDSFILVNDFKDTSKPKMYSLQYGWGWDTVSISGLLTMRDTIIPKRDTIPVFLLLSDTCHWVRDEWEVDWQKYQKRDTSNILIGIPGKTVAVDYGFISHTVWWVKAYEVRQEYGHWGGRFTSLAQGNITYDGAAYWNIDYTHIEYLAENKKPFPANIIIWMAK